ncbi:hypothetical protein OF83DRAFT_1275655 [Amylostereum chailletii]|nr:hypothetical protein OF83DRAFT_1275655 [Amylostereum chailletii]
MSRGDRTGTSGILLSSMRSNYAEHGYYKKVGATYRNPHYPGVRQCLFAWFTTWWKNEHEGFASEGPVIFDMACEAIIALQDWWTRAITPPKPIPATSASGLPLPRRQVAHLNLPGLGPGTPRPRVFAADPYTAEAYQSRVSLPCSPLSFRDVAGGALPNTLCTLPLPSSDYREGFSRPDSQATHANTPPESIDIVLCSFALHLVESPSELFALLWELSTKCRWLIVLEPHKKPEIKDGWGWTKWDVKSWSACRMAETQGEYLYDRVHCRVYRSLNLS